MTAIVSRPQLLRADSDSVQETSFQSLEGESDMELNYVTELANGQIIQHNGEVQEEDFDDELLDDDLMDKISSSPSIDDEDIDFEFVYALHTFIATVDGQANANKGDTMVLLDDSNSYWWLVRVIKDGTIGYLPAEHIETPTERLARLNKHRNIDLSATMLADNAEKSKNPLKKLEVMRRTKNKNVSFGMPEYFEPTEDMAYSSEDEGDGQFFEDDDEEPARYADEVQEEDEPENDDIEVEPLRPRTHEQEPESIAKSPSPEKQQAESSEAQEDNITPRIKNGVSRDSFYNDENTGTKKLTLTPNLLRDDSAISNTNNNNVIHDIKEIIDSAENGRPPSQNDKNKDDKRKKDKKPGMLSGLFKRKDRKNKTPSDDEVEETEKVSEDSSRSSAERKLSSESRESKEEATLASQNAQKNKLQKHSKEAPTVASPQQATPQPSEAAQFSQSPEVKTKSFKPTMVPEAAGRPPPWSRRSSESQRDDTEKAVSQPGTPQPQSQPRPEPQVRGQPVYPPPAGPPPAGPPPARPPPPEPSLAELAPTEPVLAEPASSEPSDAEPTLTVSGPVEAPDKGAEPVHVSSLNTAFPNKSVSSLENSGLVHIDNADGQPEPSSPVSSLGSVESAVEIGASDLQNPFEEPESPILTKGKDENSPTTSEAAAERHSLEAESPESFEQKESPRSAKSGSTSSNTPTWSDASLRSYLEDSEEIRDLLIIVHDNSNILPAGPEHPVTGSLFREESKGLSEMSNRLDEMLGNWLARRMSTMPAAAPNV